MLNDKNCSQGCNNFEPITPLGIISKDTWEKERHEELKNVINRYMNVGIVIPIELVEEYNELSFKLRN